MISNVVINQQITVSTPCLVADLGNLDWGEGKMGERGRCWRWAGLGGMVKGWQYLAARGRLFQGGREKANFGESNNRAK